jgi:acyl carrier protein
MTTLAEVKTTVASIIKKESGLSSVPDGEPLKDLGIDSLSTIEIVMSIEDTYDIAIDLEDVGKGKFTIDSLVAIVATKLGDKLSG